MLYWKNRPINSLTKKELQQALHDSVPFMMGNQQGQNTDQTLTAFLTGVFLGLIFTGLGIVAAYTLF